jgi:hypothetical protein
MREALPPDWVTYTVPSSATASPEVAGTIVSNTTSPVVRSTAVTESERRR